MPYKKISDLPSSVTGVLPKHAQEIYRRAFNNAWNNYKDEEKRSKGKNLEETAHSVAWSAVKHKYQKDKDGIWRAKE